MYLFTFYEYNDMIFLVNFCMCPMKYLLGLLNLYVNNYILMCIKLTYTLKLKIIFRNYTYHVYY